MATTAIEWTDATWNPTTGCDRTSPGCDNCYALTMAKRLKAMGSERYQNDGDPRTSGPGFGLTMHPDALDLPLKWRKPRRVFVNSMSDLFHHGVSGQFLGQVFDVMRRCPQHTFQVLTKRSQPMSKILPMLYRDCMPALSPEPLPNVWLGVSIESDRYAFRANHLRMTPAAVRFLSLEPLLGPLPSVDLLGIDWVIVGGESGPNARPMHPDWVRRIRDRCVAAGVPFFFKQWGEFAPEDQVAVPEKTPAGYFGYSGEWSGPRARIWGTANPPVIMAKVGKHAAGRVIDGRTWDEYPKGVVE